MKKIVLLLTLALLCAALLVGCGCKHETWKDADCVTPKTCAECGETEGEALGHSWLEANCDRAKTCSVCNKTEGNPLTHNWTEATCDAPKTCANCGKTEGEALGHTWVEATTEAPKTCTTCNATEGDRIITDPRFTTAACKDLFGSWQLTVPVGGEMMGLEGFEGTMELALLLDFSNDGKMSMSVSIAKVEEFNAALKTYMMESIYTELEKSGIGRENADEAMQQSAGMTVEAYVDTMIQLMDFEAMFSALELDGCYYVEGNKIYAGETWDGEMEPSDFTLADGKLTIPELAAELGMTDGVFTKVETQEG